MVSATRASDWRPCLSTFSTPTICPSSILEENGYYAPGEGEPRARLRSFSNVYGHRTCDGPSLAHVNSVVGPCDPLEFDRSRDITGRVHQQFASGNPNHVDRRATLSWPRRRDCCGLRKLVAISAGLATGVGFRFARANAATTTTTITPASARPGRESSSV